MSPPVILLVDDEPSIQQATSVLLRSRGYAVVVVATGTEALASFERILPSLVILDLGLPDIDGATVCERLRARTDVPILVLSVRNDERSKVRALDAGADDYVMKPFGPEELLARIRAGLRRSAGQQELHGKVEHGDLAIDFDRRRVYRDDVEIRLTPKEFDLLILLASQAGRVMTHRAISRRLWGVNAGAQLEPLRVLVGQLRKKVEPDPAHPRYVLTEPWVGYRFSADVRDG